MNEKEEFIEDYKECIDRIKEFDKYNYMENKLWALQKYSKWIQKDSRYERAITFGTKPPVNEKECAWNSLNNLKYTLEKIAGINFYNQ